MCPIAYKNFQRKFNILLNIKLTLKQLPKTFKMLKRWRNFAKSGHPAGRERDKERERLTERERERERERDRQTDNVQRTLT